MKNILKRIWTNPVVKVIAMAAAGATGGILAVPGEILLDKAHVMASVSAATAAVWGLFVQHPTKPGA